MPHDGGKARAGLPLRLMRFTARSPGRTHGWQAGTSQMCGRRDLPDMSGIDPVAAPEPPHGPSFPPMCRPCGHTAEHDRSQVAITQKRQRSAPHCSWGWPQQMIRDVLPVSGEDDKPDGIGKRMSGRSRKYAAKLCYHTTVGCSSNFLICVCDLVCRGKTRVKRCGEAPSIFSGKTQVSQRRETKDRETESETKVVHGGEAGACYGDTSNSIEQRGLYRRGAGFLCASANHIQAEKAGHSAGIPAGCFEIR